MRRTVIGAAAAVAAIFGIWASVPGAQSVSPPKPVVTQGDLTWEVQYLIDTSQQTGGISQFSTPRSNRGVGLSADGRYLYLGYNEPNGPAVAGQHDHQVRMIDTTVSDVTDATLAILTRHRGKSIATDDRGRVYLAEGSDTDVHLSIGGIHIQNAGLGVELAQMPLGATYGLAKPEGVTTTRENGVLVLYATDRTNKRLHRFEVTEAPTGDAILAITKAGLFTGTGQVDVPGAVDLRGVKVDTLGRIWMADLNGGKVFRCAADGSACTSAPVPKAMDIGLIGARAYITQSTAPISPTLVVLRQDDLGVLQTTLAPPWAGLKLDPLGQKTSTPSKTPLGTLAGAAATRTSTGEKLLYLANERGQTESEKSVYGRCDASSDNPGGPCVFTDVTVDDNELVFRIVEPNFPPVANCQPILLDADAACSATGSVNNVSYDPDRDEITVTHSLSSYALGENQVMLTVTDQYGAAASCSAVVTVRDVTPPTLECPAPVFASTEPGSCSAIVNPGAPAGADNCSVAVTGVRSDGLDLSAPFAVGTTTIDWTATDTVSSVSCAPQPITVTATNPIVTMISPAAGAHAPVGSPVTFSASYTGEALAATWTFNGTTVAGTINPVTRVVTATHTFTTVGAADVALTVSNGCGGAGTTVSTFSVTGAGKISDFVWNDSNGNGVQNAGEPGLANINLQLKNSSGTVIRTATTNGAGFYQFTGLDAGTYTVNVVNPPAGFAASPNLAGGNALLDSNGSPAAVTLATATSVDQTIDFGYVPAPTASLALTCPANTGTVGAGYSSGGVASGGAPPYTFSIATGALPPGLTLNAATGAITGTPTTAGSYSFRLKVTDSTGASVFSSCVGTCTPTTVTWNFNLPSGVLGTSSTYTVNGIPITAYGFTNAGAPKALYGKNQAGSGFGLGISGPPANEIDVNNFVQLDFQSAIDSGATSAQMSIGNVQAGASYNVYGSNTLGSIGTLLGAANRTLANSFFVIPGFPTYRFISVRATSLDVLVGHVRLTMAAECAIVIAPPGTGVIGHMVWNDVNGNGIRTTGEPGLAGVTVQLKNAAGAVVQTTTTAANGVYQFQGLPAGAYTVVVTPPAGFVPTVSQAPGSTTANDSNGSPAPVTLATNSSINRTIDFGFRTGP